MHVSTSVFFNTLRDTARKVAFLNIHMSNSKEPSASNFIFFIFEPYFHNQNNLSGIIMPYCVLHAALFPRGGNYCVHHLITSAVKMKQSFQQHSLWSQGKTSIRMTKPVHTGLSR